MRKVVVIDNVYNYGGPVLVICEMHCFKVCDHYLKIFYIVVTEICCLDTPNE